jgi:hypothetical protein
MCRCAEEDVSKGKVPQALAPSAAESARPGDACEQGEPVQSVSPCASCAESRVESGSLLPVGLPRRPG